MIPRLTGAALILGCATAVGPHAEAPRANVTRGCVKAFDATADYFPDKVSLEDAANFTVSYHRSYKVVTVRETPTGDPAETYVLVQCGAPRPAFTGALANATVATVPVTSFYSASTTHLPLLGDLGRLDVLTGVARLKDLTGDAIQARVRAGQIREFAPVDVVDAELIVSQRPGLLMASGTPSASLAAVRRTGVPVVANTAWLEPTALARAEWIKYLAVFLNEERAAQRLHGEMKGRYRALSDRAVAVPDAGKPLVMTGRGSSGNFVIAGGRSYVAALIRDAGGRYVWADDTAVGTRTLDLEAQLRRAAKADIWINGGGWRDLEAMVEDEPRYGLFKAYRQRQVWVYERRLSSTGANDYWSRSVSRPDVVLADLVKIFHPRLLPAHTFEWYMPVAERRP
jgi:iron complex transport system substrate-binding protein